ncbi:hypothetical protein TSPI_00186 [Trichinella spiralis]|uniref:Uncharacterized protein n=1 Tax=Trichinella spiralis TaxID=6334 RepID=A0ABR3L092_TRISP
MDQSMGEKGGGFLLVGLRNWSVAASFLFSCPHALEYRNTSAHLVGGQYHLVVSPVCSIYWHFFGAFICAHLRYTQSILFVVLSLFRLGERVLGSFPLLAFCCSADSSRHKDADVKLLLLFSATQGRRQHERTLEAHVREFSATTSQKIACGSFREDFSDRRSTSARTACATCFLYKCFFLPLICRRFVLSLTANDNVDDEVALRNEMLPSIQ